MDWYECCVINVLIIKFIRKQFENVAAWLGSFGIIHVPTIPMWAENSRNDACMCPGHLLIDSYLSYGTKTYFDVTPFMRSNKLNQRFNWHLAWTQIEILQIPAIHYHSNDKWRNVGCAVGSTTHISDLRFHFIDFCTQNGRMHKRLRYVFSVHRTGLLRSVCVYVEARSRAWEKYRSASKWEFVFFYFLSRFK